MSSARKSLVTIAAASLIIGWAFATDTQTQGPGSANQQPLNVSVSNTPTVREARKEPFNRTVQFGVADGEFFSAAELTVPAGKQLVTTFISAEFAHSGQTAKFALRAGDGGVGAVLHKLASDTDDSGHVVVNEPLQLYLDEGQFLTLQVRRGVSDGIAAVNFNVSGYLVPMTP